MRLKKYELVHIPMVVSKLRSIAIDGLRKQHYGIPERVFDKLDILRRKDRFRDLSWTAINMPQISNALCAGEGL